MSVLVSIIIRSHNDQLFLSRNISAILTQNLEFEGYRIELEFIHIDNDSKDQSRAIISKLNPNAKLLQWHKKYIPGAVLNYAIKNCKGKIIVFHNADAIPSDSFYIQNLILPILKNEADFSFAQQVPREDAHPWVCLDHQRAFGDGLISAQWDNFFSLVSSSVKREIVKKMPFDETYHYSEDVQWSTRLKKAGYRLVYCKNAIVEHSHNYTLKACFRRFYNEGVAWRMMSPLAKPSYKELLFSLPVACMRDFIFIIKKRKFHLLVYGLTLRITQRFAQFIGKFNTKYIGREV